jgi:hypothetical protein
MTGVASTAMRPDFYQRIYLHRIENTLDAATANKGVKRFIEKLIKQVRSKEPLGIVRF